jgi:hypothetical protein
MTAGKTKALLDRCDRREGTHPTKLPDRVYPIQIPARLLP